MTAGHGTPAERYEELADLYDDLHPFDADAADAVTFLERLAAGGDVLELAVGTGRIALPLAARGCAVTGVDASPDMLRVLHSKDSGETVRTILGDISELALADHFDLIYLVANSLFELTTQEDQVACLKAAAEHLRPGGRLVVEAALPNWLFADRRPLFVGHLEELDTVTMQAMKYDLVGQVVQYRHIFIAASGIKVMPTTHRLVYLPELDLMAALAGLARTDRHSDWTGGGFDPARGRHVSVYTRQPAADDR
ncbi:class I SAM-dependent methyltransferase [Saccharothrix obliqua]|uniref:class I SAM-dependent methyltransferase n=1 Tax=Saccharothrix obliqua TaxID=2861747 RepID=UPI001C5E1921|nr:class I SAM-dependent methyltransferase [Saccharothrix obliqua]MBW4717513.1 class I SAM-dependent methyltransferase [Saccharothrix obliqua]